MPGPAEVAVALPVPKADQQDPNWKELQRTSYADPAGLLQLSDEWLASPELHLLRCRLHLELARDQLRGRDQQLVAAAMELDRAGRLLGDRRRYDWRLDWHRGLTELAHGHVRQALTCFDEVYDAIPGEYAPKLALGYCHEKLADSASDAETREGHEQQAMRFYDAVWRRNHALGSAAFGLARIHLARRSPDLALASLDGVPPDSRHRTAARTAMVRIHASTARRRVTADRGIGGARLRRAAQAGQSRGPHRPAGVRTAHRPAPGAAARTGRRRTGEGPAGRAARLTAARSPRTRR